MFTSLDLSHRCVVSSPALSHVLLFLCLSLSQGLSLYILVFLSQPPYALSSNLTHWCNFPVVPQHFSTMQFYFVSQIYLFTPNFETTFRSSICF